MAGVIVFIWICGRAILTRPDDPFVQPLRREDDGPVFDEPWQAQILAIADALVTNELVTPGQWSQTLGDALDAMNAEGAPDTAETYYRAVTSAAETLLAARGHVSGDAVDERVTDWARAYERTPHGEPVEL